MLAQLQSTPQFSQQSSENIGKSGHKKPLWTSRIETASEQWLAVLMPQVILQVKRLKTECRQFPIESNFIVVEAELFRNSWKTFDTGRKWDPDGRKPPPYPNALNASTR